MNFTDSIKTCFSKYAVFGGRAQRSEFWWFFLFSAVSSAIANIVPVIGQIYPLVLLIPSLAVAARRLHDTGRSAWWLLLYLASFLAMGAAFVAGLLVWIFESERPNDEGAIISAALVAIVSLVIALGCSIVPLIFYALPGTVGPNRYGPDPLHPEQEVGSVGEAARYSAPSDPVSKPAPEGTLFCSQCGTRLPADSGFCPSCGTAI